MTALPAEGLRADAHIAAAALHLLLAQHPELVELPLEWRIGADAEVRPFLPVDHPQARTAARLLAQALELRLEPRRYATADGEPRESLTVEGRWGGAAWWVVFYTSPEGGEES